VLHPISQPVADDGDRVAFFERDLSESRIVEIQESGREDENSENHEAALVDGES
jgi:hypothetical protein